MSRPSTKRRQNARTSAARGVSSDSRKRVRTTSKKTTTRTKADTSHATIDAAGPSREPYYTTRSRTRAAAGQGCDVHGDGLRPSTTRRRLTDHAKGAARVQEPIDVVDDESKFTLIRADLRDFEYFSEALLRDREDTREMECTIAVSEEGGSDTIAVIFHQKEKIPSLNLKASTASLNHGSIDLWDYMRAANENDTAYRVVHELKALRSTNYFSLRDELSDDADQAAAKARILDFQRRQQEIFACQNKSAAAQGSLDAVRNTDMVVDGIYGRIAQHFSSSALESRYQKNLLFKLQDKIIRELGIPLEERYPSRTDLEDDAVLAAPVSSGDEAQPVSVPFPFRSKKRARDASESDADDNDGGTTPRCRKRPRRHAPEQPRARARAGTAWSGAATMSAGPAGSSTANAQAFPTPPTDEPVAGPSTAPESTVEPLPLVQRALKDRKGKGRARAGPPAGRFSQYIKDEDLSDIALGMSLGWKIMTGGAAPMTMDAVGPEARAIRIPGGGVDPDDATVKRPTKRRRTTKKR